MPIPHYAYWDNPWITPVLGTDPDPRDFVDGYITFGAGHDSVPPNWQVGVVASALQVTFTCVSARTVEVLIYEDDPGGSAIIGGDVFAVSPGTHTVSFPIVAQAYDLLYFSFYFGGIHEAADSFDSATVVPGTPNLSEFWTDFVKSYEVP